MKAFIRYILLAILFSLFPIVSNAQAVDTKTIVHKTKKRIEQNMTTMTDLPEAMANTLGQLHYLRSLCFGRSDQKWRTKAAQMMQLEAGTNASYHRQLIRAFNAGYYEQEARYKKCTKTVAIDVAALAENGRRLSIMLGDPYRERAKP